MKFRQSCSAFPMTVTLGEKNPHFGLHRFNKPLRFIPLDEENFSLRGGKQRLLYKGKQRSHRFTILGDKSFEYDCILKKPPDSNVISLLMEGAEHYDFFRQPDFVRNPFLQGSYAVYKKETLLGEGTGKLCHIHRPEIIDARGRRCWGNLAVIGNELRITIPEQWLGEAAYPVIVDPIVGTEIAGSQNTWEPDPKEFQTLVFEGMMPVNRFLVPEAINGFCTAYFYTDRNDSDAGCRPVLYSDNGNKPQARKSTAEQFIDLRIKTGSPKGWRNGGFKTDGVIASGSYIWFGAFTEFMWYPLFDYGAKCYYDDWTVKGDTIPNTYPLYSANQYENFKLSMFLYYTQSFQYVRTITQGVSVTDSRKRIANYKRNSKQTVKVNSVLSRFEAMYRHCAMMVQNSMLVNRFPLFVRNATEQIKVTTANSENRSLSRKCNDDVEVNSETNRTLAIFRKIIDSLTGIDSQNFSVLFVRSMRDVSMVSDKSRHLGSFIRGLLATAGSVAETTHNAEYYRFQKDKVQAKGTVFRGLLLFVRIITKVFVRDYLLRRFLVAREELALKSNICREVTLESKLS